ncbi:hypothetical protein D8770_24995 [Methylobacterium sp. DB1607]|nr:hypothetical protein [Methylobacterium sp. DB1607]
MWQGGKRLSWVGRGVGHAAGSILVGEPVAILWLRRTTVLPMISWLLRRRLAVLRSAQPVRRGVGHMERGLVLRGRG